MSLISHLSDHHGVASKLPVLGGDIIVLSGDMLPNCFNTTDERVGDWRAAEVAYQSQYVIGHADDYRRAFGSKPVVSVSGNHCYIDMAAHLRGIGINAVSVEDGVQVVNGLRFAGFRQVRRVSGLYEGEVEDFSGLVADLMASNPDVVVIHQPVDGILSDDGGHGHGRGVPMYRELFYGDHNIKAVLCGHIHPQGRQVVEHGGIIFSNAACSTNEVALR